MKRVKDKKPRKGWIIALLTLLCVAGFFGFMALNAATVHLRRATVFLEDLPPAFEGKSLLFASDIDLSGINTPKRAAEVFKHLEILHPDLLILGGDYTAPTLTDLINQTPVAEYAANRADSRGDFLHYISGFPAALGKYMIVSPDDRMAGDIRPLAQEAGFQLLDGERAEIRLGNESIWLVSMGGNAGEVARKSRSFKKEDCVIALSYSPTQFPTMMTSEASDSGHWVDLNLTGHTHGGQIVIFGHSIITLDSTEQQYMLGWNRETGVPMLVSTGLGCEGVNLRLNSSPEVWLITLTGQSNTQE